MDTLRGPFGSFDDDTRDEDYGDDDVGNEAPPSPVGQDERRMQVRAYNHWASLLQDRNFPAIDDLDAANLPDFGPHSVLLDFSDGIENPGINYLGGALAEECGAAEEISTLDDVPSRSLLSRITDHYMQILANQAPIGFEAEFVNQRGATILYRGILLPFSSDDETIDFIYGVINWKEVADQLTTDELLLEIDQALDEAEESESSARSAAPVTDWADGPVAEAEPGFSESDESESESLAESSWLDEGEDDEPLTEFVLPDLGDLDEEDTINQEAYASLSPASEMDQSDVELSGLAGMRAKPAKKPLDLSATAALLPTDEDEGEPVDPAAFSGEEFDESPSVFDDDEGRFANLLGSDDSEEDPDDWNAPLSPQVEASTDTSPLGHVEQDSPKVQEPEQSAEPSPPIAEEVAEPQVALPQSVEPSEAAGLYDTLADARELAQMARTSEDRSRTALYEAVSRAYDVSLVAAAAPDDFADLVEENGLVIQDRAPMTPVVKLVFGVDYDKTRVTEYAAVLEHAHRHALERGALADFLAKSDGGLKGIVQAERRLRREEAGKPVEPKGAVRASLARKLRKLDAVPLDALSSEGAEFGVVMIRRLENGEIVVLGEVQDDIALVEKVGRKLVG